MSLIGIGVGVTCLIVSRFMTEAAYKHLDKLQKGDLVDRMSGLRKYSLLAFLPVLVFGSHVLPSNQQISRTLTLILFVVWVAGLEVLVFRKMKSIPLPVKYLKALYRGRAVLYIGFLVIMGTLI